MSYKTQDSKVSKEQHKKELNIRTESDTGDSEVTSEDLTSTSSSGNAQEASNVEKVVSTSKTKYIWKPGGPDGSKKPIKTSENVTQTTTLKLVNAKGTKIGSDILLEMNKGDEKQITKELSDIPIQGGSYENIRDLLSQVNDALLLYASNLAKGILKGKAYKQKVTECVIKYKRLYAECRESSQDKVKLQDVLDDLTSKFNAMEHVLLKVKDVNKDNRQLIEELRANRDHCMKDQTNKTKTIHSLRDQTAILRGKLAQSLIEDKKPSSRPN